MQKTDYIKNIDLAISFIDNNLDTELTLETIAKTALYSPYHFHRIFKAIIGETLYEYITRKRIERAALDLEKKSEINITEIALQYGFGSNSSFTKMFKKFYGISPSEFRKKSQPEYYKLAKIKSKNGQESLVFEKYLYAIEDHLLWIKKNATVEVKEVSKLNFIGINHHGIAGIEKAFQKVLTWGHSKGLFTNPKNKIARIFHDNLRITDENKVRMNIGFFTTDTIEKEEVKEETIEKSKCIVGHFKISPSNFERAWSSLFVWMVKNGYRKSKENYFEIYHNDFLTPNPKELIVDMYIPIE